MRLKAFFCLVTLLLTFCLVVPATFAAEKPNILIIWGDDIGYWKLSHINHGMMGYKTPNIDRIASEGLDFPPRQEPGSFSVDRMIQQMEAARVGGK